MSIYLANVLTAIACIVGGYLLGSIPNGVIIGKVFFHKDPRDYYSHNSGGTNVGRVLGKKVGILVIVLDAIKTSIPLFASFAVLSFVPGIAKYMIWGNGYNAAPLWYWLSGFFALVGHCFPIYLGFRGGKAVSSFVGLEIFFSYIEVALFPILFFGCLKKTKMVSISSIIASSSCAVVTLATSIALEALHLTDSIGYYLTWSFGGFYLEFGLEAGIVCFLSAAVLVIRHIPNIIRIRNGSESKISWMK